MKAKSSLGEGIPVDLTARRVVAPGEHFHFRDQASMVRSQTPIPTRPTPAAQPEFVNYTGRRFGRLVVVGVADLPKSSRGTPWVVRCDCGWYEVRRNPFFTHVPLEEQMCSHCYKLERCKQGWLGKKENKEPNRAQEQADRERRQARIAEAAKAWALWTPACGPRKPWVAERIGATLNWVVDNTREIGERAFPSPVERTGRPEYDPRFKNKNRIAKRAESQRDLTGNEETDALARVAELLVERAREGKDRKETL